MGLSGDPDIIFLKLYRGLRSKLLHGSITAEEDSQGLINSLNVDTEREV